MPDEQGVIFTRRASGLVRELSWFDVFVFVVAGSAASGVIFYSVSTAADFPGASLPLAFLVGLLIFFPITLLVALSSATMPRSGGLYIAVSRVLGPTIGYLSAWLLFVGYGISSGVLMMSLSVNVILSVLTLTVFFIFWSFGLSAMLLPYHKPEIYERSPVKWEVGGVPLMTILGAFTFAAERCVHRDGPPPRRPAVPAGQSSSSSRTREVGCRGSSFQ